MYYGHNNGTVNSLYSGTSPVVQTAVVQPVVQTGHEGCTTEISTICTTGDTNAGYTHQSSAVLPFSVRKVARREPDHSASPPDPSDIPAVGPADANPPTALKQDGPGPEPSKPAELISEVFETATPGSFQKIESSSDAGQPVPPEAKREVNEYKLETIDRDDPYLKNIGPPRMNDDDCGPFTDPEPSRPRISSFTGVPYPPRFAKYRPGVDTTRPQGNSSTATSASFHEKG